MVKKFILVSLFVLTVALLPMTGEWSNMSTALASTGTHRI